MVGEKDAIFCISLTQKDMTDVLHVWRLYTVYKTTHLIAIYNTVDIYIYLWHIYSREYWIFLVVIWFGSSPNVFPPSPVSCLSFSVFMFVELAEEGGKGVGKEPNQTSPRKSGSVRIIQYSLICTVLCIGRRYGGQCWNFKAICEGKEPSRNRFVVPAARLHRLAETLPWNRFLGSIKV